MSKALASETKAVQTTSGFMSATLYFPIFLTPKKPVQRSLPILLLKLSPLQAAFAARNAPTFDENTAVFVAARAEEVLRRLGYSEMSACSASLTVLPPGSCGALKDLVERAESGATPFIIDISGRTDMCAGNPA